MPPIYTTSMATTHQLEVKEFINKKFENLGRFAKLAGYDLATLHNLFKMKPGPDFEAMEAKARRMKNRPTPDEITPKEREKLRKLITSKYGTVPEFCRQTGADYRAANNILATGANAAKVKSKNARAVFDKAGIKV